MAQVLRGRRQMRQDQIEAQRALNWELAGLISFAFHNPKKMPTYRRIGEPQARVPQRPATEADHAIIRAYFKRLAKMDEKQCRNR